MVTIDDIPKYIRYDFFMALLGLVIIYFVIITENIYQNTILTILFLFVGIPFFLWGVYEMKKNYDKEKRLQHLKMDYENWKITHEKEEFVSKKEKSKISINKKPPLNNLLSLFIS